MNKYLCALALGCAAVASDAIAQSPDAPQQATDLRTDVEQMLSADRGFAAASARAGGLAAFSAMFDDDVVMFAVPVPGFARGREQAVEFLTRALGSAAGRTEWVPIRGGVSADGRHGFTFGYTTTRIDGQPDQVGKYVAYWVRREQGWRVALYKRVTRAEGEVSLAAMAPALPSAPASPVADTHVVDQYRESLAARERAFSDASQRIGLGPAFARFGSADAVNVGGGAEFVVGADAIGEVQGTGPSPLRWEPDGGVIVASTGDLGVTWGFLHRNGPTPPGRLDVIPFFTVWRRNSTADPWLYVAE